MAAAWSARSAGGGMGVVYEAQLSLDRRLALKVLRRS